MRLANLGKILGIAFIAMASASASVAVAAEVVDDTLPSATVRYKMTVNVETPEGLKTGSAVREVHMFTEPVIPGMPGGGGGHVGATGEAVVVDLGKRGKLFALLRNSSGPDYAYYVLLKSFPWPGSPGKPGGIGGALTKDGIRYYQTLKEGSKILEAEDYPMMVTFHDMNDPKTIEPVWIGEFYDETNANGIGAHQAFRVKEDNFEKLFGQGVRLKNVVIEVTQEPVNWNIEKYLSWLPDYFNQMFDGQRYNTAFSKLPLANSLSAGNFSTGEKNE